MLIQIILNFNAEKFVGFSQLTIPKINIFFKDYKNTLSFKGFEILPNQAKMQFFILSFIILVLEIKLDLSGKFGSSIFATTLRCKSPDQASFRIPVSWRVRILWKVLLFKKKHLVNLCQPKTFQSLEDKTKNSKWFRILS